MAVDYLSAINSNGSGLNITQLVDSLVEAEKAPQENIIQNKLQIKIGDYVVAENGKVGKDYNENDLKEYMKWESINIEVNLNIGSAKYTVYTCDFTNDYIDINTDYRN